MSRIRLTAVAAIACVALAVPAAASAAIGSGTPLQVILPAESAWTFCANEGARCAFSGTQQVRYGANGKFTLPRTFTGGVACNNAVFGDPVFGVVKQCQVATGSAPGGTPVTGSQTTEMKDEAATAAAIADQQQQMAEWSQYTQAQTSVQAKSDAALDSQLSKLAP